MPQQPHYDLVDILRRLQKKKRNIFNITMLAAIAGVLFYLVIPRCYKAETILILKNPLYGDRNNVYNMEAKFMNYAGNDEDMDRFFSMAASDSLQNNIIRIMHLAAAYHFDSTDAVAILKLKKYFTDRLTITRNEYKNVVVSYKDKDPKRAAAIANLTADMLEFSMRDFYNGMRRNLYASVMNTVKQEDSAIAVLTDSLATLREKYGIYDIISPARYNIMLSNMQKNDKEGYAKGVELIQNVESIKDELVSDRAKHITLANQYATGTEMKEMSLIHVIQKATPPLKHWWRNLVFTFCVSAALGFFFAVVYILFSGYYYHIITRGV